MFIDQLAAIGLMFDVVPISERSSRLHWRFPLDGIERRRSVALDFEHFRTVSRSMPVCLAIADTDRPCRCKSRIIIVSLSLITDIPLPTIGRSIDDDAPPVYRGAPRKTGYGANWGRFKRHFWGVLLR